MAGEKGGRGRAGRCTPQHCFAFIAPGCCSKGPLHILQGFFAPGPQELSRTPSSQRVTQAAGLAQCNGTALPGPVAASSHADQGHIS